MGIKGLGMLAAFWTGIPVEVTHEVGVVPHCRRVVFGTPFQSPHAIRRNTVVVFYHPPTRGGEERRRMVKKDLRTLMFPSTSSTFTRLLGINSETSDPQFIWILDSVIKYSQVKNTL